jgi:DNA-binding transcriptional LysR family regulator
MEMLNYRALSVFLTTVEHGTFSAAADVLGVSQPTLSQHVQGLEKDLGFKLFHRGGRQLKLSPDGEQLYASLQKPFSEIDFAWATAMNQSNGRGNITVASVHTLFSYFLPQVLTSFADVHPRSHPDIRGRSSAEVVKMTLSRSVDLGLVYDTSYVTDALESMPLFVEDIVAVFHPDFPYAEKISQSGELDPSVPVISFQSGYALRSLMDRMTRKVPLNIVAEIDNTELILSLAANRTGVALLPRGFAQRRAPELGLAWSDLRYPKITRTVVAIWRQGEGLKPLSQAFLDTCREVAAVD